MQMEPIDLIALVASASALLVGLYSSVSRRNTGIALYVQIGGLRLAVNGDPKETIRQLSQSISRADLDRIRSSAGN